MESNVMIKHKFVDFIVDEIERCQKQMYANDGEGKLVVTELIQIYTMVTDGKFDGHGNTHKEPAKWGSGNPELRDPRLMEKSK